MTEGKPLPPGWILDPNGNPSTDPADLVAGLGVPIGGHKGYGLTLVMGSWHVPLREPPSAGTIAGSTRRKW